ncbi:MAG: SDR family NAD(P)-dependent oxidoreductase [Nanoarchaeota archaeon]
MRVMITGITGFIGSELAHKLVNEGHEVFGIVRHVIGRNLESIENIKGKIKMIVCDITDYTSIKNAIQKVNPDVVLHLAALSPVRLSFEHPIAYQKVNYLGSVNIAEAILELYGPEKVRLVVASTAEVYGIKEFTPFTEDMSLEASSPYAVSKAAMDIYMRMLNKVYNFNVVILRNSNTFGRKYDPGFFTEYLITEMIKGKDIYIGAPDSIRDYMYVDDHVNSYLLAMKTKNIQGNAFNISGGKGITNKEWASKIAKLIGFPESKLHLGEFPPGYPNRPLASDQPYLVLDSARARKILHWEQTVSPEEGLKKTIDYWKRKFDS